MVVNREVCFISDPVMGGMVRWWGKRSVGAEVLVAGVMQTSDPRRPALEALPNLSLNVSNASWRFALRALNEAALCATA